MKYMGSKNRIAKYILPIILKDRKEGQWYVEPFVGGANMIDKVDGNRLGSDSHHFLIEMLRALRDGWIPSKITKDEYVAARNSYEKMDAHLIGWIGFNCSYSGKWFGGFAGEVKTKTGTTRDYQAEAIKNAMAQASGLKGIRFACTPYMDLEIPDNSIVYCDPPYKGTTSYKDGFDHDAFWGWVREKSKAHTVFVSEYNAPNDFECVWSMEVKSSLSANGKHGESKESTERLFKWNPDK